MLADEIDATGRANDMNLPAGPKERGERLLQIGERRIHGGEFRRARFAGQSAFPRQLYDRSYGMMALWFCPRLARLLRCPKQRLQCRCARSASSASVIKSSASSCLALSS